MMRSKHFIIVMICIFISAATTAAYGEFYRYTDDNGVVRFTDDLSKVPQNQLPRMTAYAEYIAPPTPEQNTLETSQEEFDISEEETDIEVPEKKDLADLKKLNKKKAELDKEYALLVKEKDALVKAEREIKTEAQLREYHEKTVDLNERIKAFENRRKLFSAEASEFNDRFSE